MRSKIKILMVLAVIFTFAGGVTAHAFDLEARGRMNVYQDQALEERGGVEVRAGLKNVFVFGSYDQTVMRLYGQQAGDIDLWGFGFGLRYDLLEYLSVWGQLGYYLPGSTMADHPDQYHETLRYVFRGFKREWGPPAEYFPAQNYRYALSEAIGGALGLDFRYPLTEALTINLSAGYRFLKVEEDFYMGGDPGNGRYYSNLLEHSGSRNFSAGMVGLGFTYRW